MSHLPITARQLRRFKCEDLEAVAGEWSALPRLPGWQATSLKTLTDLARSPSGKKRFVNAVLGMAKKTPFSYEEMAELDLIYVRMHSKLKKWTALKLTPIPGESFSCSLTVDEFRTALGAELSSYCYTSSVRACLLDGVQWTCVYVDDGRKGYYPPNAIFTAQHPRTLALCVTGCKAAYRDTFYQALAKVLSCGSVVQLELGGRCVKSLLQIALQTRLPPDASGKKTNHPLISTSRKRKRSEDEVDHDERILCEDSAMKQRQREFITQDFGDGALPTLEKLHYTLETSMHGQHIVAPNTLLRCKVQIEGTSVIDGVRNLGLAHLADFPVRNMLGRIPSMQRNKFFLREKKGARVGAAL